jgi:hypothetical protein
MERPAQFLLLGVASRGLPGRPAVTAGRVTGLLAGPGAHTSLPAAALRLPHPLGFPNRAEIRAWLLARESRLAAALNALSGCREVGLRLEEDAPCHAAWLRLGDRGLAGGAGTGPARAARRALVARRLEAILVGEARAALLPRADQPEEWSVTLPEEAVHRLRAALDVEAARLAGTGLSLLVTAGEPRRLAQKILQDG